MRPSEIPTQTEAVTLPYPRSKLADPLISEQEALNAQPTVCPWHKGRIAHSPTPSDWDGKVYFCPVGKQFWRYSTKVNELLRPLRYKWRA